MLGKIAEVTARGIVKKLAEVAVFNLVAEAAASTGKTLVQAAAYKIYGGDDDHAGLPMLHHKPPQSQPINITIVNDSNKHNKSRVETVTEGGASNPLLDQIQFVVEPQEGEVGE